MPDDFYVIANIANTFEFRPIAILRLEEKKNARVTVSTGGIRYSERRGDTKQRRFFRVTTCRVEYRCDFRSFVAIGDDSIVFKRKDEFEKKKKRKNCFRDIRGGGENLETEGGGRGSNCIDDLTRTAEDVVRCRRDK